MKSELIVVAHCEVSASFYFLLSNFFSCHFLQRRSYSKALELLTGTDA